MRLGLIGEMSERVREKIFSGSFPIYPYMYTLRQFMRMNGVKKQEIEDLKNNLLRQRYGAIIAARNSQKFGILIGVKRGQQRLKVALAAKKMLDAAGKTSFFITLDDFSYEALQGFSDIECYVSTACPRIAIDDYNMYKKPIITPVELEIVLGRREWEQYEFDQITD
jgi:2-(3-amino-3-carboxypropyl)histidine synthase